MHEASLVTALLDRAEEEARAHGAVAITRVTVRIGELAGVEPELFRSAYELLREPTLCAQAELVLSSSPVRWSCSRCATEIAPGRPLRCPRCDAPARLASGDEILLERLELEVA